MDHRNRDVPTTTDIFFQLQRVLIERRDKRQFNHGFVPNCYILYKMQTAYLCGTNVWELLVYEQDFFFFFKCGCHSLLKGTVLRALCNQTPQEVGVNLWCF